MSENHIVSLRPAPSTVSAVSTPPAQSRRRGKITVILILFAVLAGAVWYFAPLVRMTTSVNNAVPVASSTVATPEVKNDDAVAKVGALIDLPEGEAPTIATVSDPSKLEGQAFFAKASKGDIVLIYTKAREAYLYDPVRNKLVQVASITTNPGATALPTQVATGTAATGTVQTRAVKK